MNLQQQNSAYNDFILQPPLIIKRISPAQLDLQKQYILLMRALSEKKYMTVKELHDVYFDEASRKHAKTLKTIYRYMETLENAELVQVGGHRKPIKGSITEKLFCRSAIILIPKEQTEEIAWWKTQEGHEISALYSKYLEKYLKVPQIHSKRLNSTINSFFSLENDYIKAQFDEIENNPELSVQLSTLPTIHIKEVLRLASYLRILQEHPEFIAEVEKLTDK